MTFVAQLAAVILISGALVVPGSLPNSILDGSAQDTVAAP